MEYIKLFEEFKNIIIAYHGSDIKFTHFNNDYLKTDNKGFNAF